MWCVQSAARDVTAHLCAGLRLQPADPGFGGGAAEASNVASTLWGGAVDVVTAEAVPKSRFYALLEAEGEDEGGMASDDEAEAVRRRECESRWARAVRQALTRA